MLDNILIKCSTKELAEELMEVLDNLKIKWTSKRIASSHTNWEGLKKDTVYCIENNTLGYSNIKYFRNNSDYYEYKWYTAEEFINKYKDIKIMTKEDLKAGMVIEYRNGERRLIIPDCNNNLMFLGLFGFTDERNFKNDLLHRCNSDLDIMKVYNINNIGNVATTLNNNNYLNLLWERKEPKEYTMQEIADKLGIPVEELRIKK